MVGELVNHIFGNGSIAFRQALFYSKQLSDQSRGYDNTIRAATPDTVLQPDKVGYHSPEPNSHWIQQTLYQEFM